MKNIDPSSQEVTSKPNKTSMKQKIDINGSSRTVRGSSHIHGDHSNLLKKERTFVSFDASLFNLDIVFLFLVLFHFTHHKRL